MIFERRGLRINAQWIYVPAILSGKRDRMVKSCCAVGCAKRAVKGCGVSFYRFPADLDRRARWIAAIKRKNWQPTKNSWVCSSHFISGAKSDEPLSPDFVPSIFSHTDSPAKRQRINALQTYNRRKQMRLSRGNSLRLELEVDEDVGEDVTAHGNLRTLGIQAYPEMSSVEIQTEMNGVEVQTTQSNVDTQTDMSQQSLEEGISKAQYEVRQLHKSFESFQMTLDSLGQDKLKFYTGLESVKALKAVFGLVSPYIEEHHLSSLTKNQQFLMVLMKLRLNLTDQDLGYRFGVSQSTVSKNWKKWIDIMYFRLKPLVLWPEREQLKKTMPPAFKRHFGKCVCIIDCFELFCERPSDLMARAQTYSQYKHHNTVKFLIGISPQGVISYVSKGWGGRVSDKYLTENCGLLNHVLPGDQILADRGFTVQESVGFYCGELIIPPFTKGKKQLSQVEVDTARQLSSVRIHVERVIGLLRNKYTILQSTIPINMIMCTGCDNSTIDKVVLICSALCNCCKSVVQVI